MRAFLSGQIAEWDYAYYSKDTCTKKRTRTYVRQELNYDSAAKNTRDYPHTMRPTPYT